MDPTGTTPFDDPALKAAVRSAWGGQRCPDALRSKLLAIAAGESDASRPVDSRSPAVAGTIRPDAARPDVAAPAVPPAPRFWQHPWLRYGLAAAATVLIGFGVAYRLDDTPFGRDQVAVTGPGSGTPVTLANALPGPIAKGMLDSHARCQTYASHDAYPDVADHDFPAMRRRLEKHLGFPVLAGDVEEALGRNGWQFQGASVCEVGGVAAAHLVFVRKGQAISIFSLPRDTCRTARDGKPQECEDPNPDHPVALFVWSNGVHCVVGSSTDRSLSVDQVRSVLEHLRPTLAAPR